MEKGKRFLAAYGPSPRFDTSGLNIFERAQLHHLMSADREGLPLVGRDAIQWSARRDLVAGTPAEEFRKKALHAAQQGNVGLTGIYVNMARKLSPGLSLLNAASLHLYAHEVRVAKGIQQPTHQDDRGIQMEQAHYLKPYRRLVSKLQANQKNQK